MSLVWITLGLVTLVTLVTMCLPAPGRRPFDLGPWRDQATPGTWGGPR